MKAEKYKEAVRLLYISSPEAARAVEDYVQELETRVHLMEDDDAFRAFVLELARQTGTVQSLLERVEASILDKIVEAELTQVRTAKLKAEHESRWFELLTESLKQPWIVLLICVFSLVVAVLLNLLLHFAGLPLISLEALPG